MNKLITVIFLLVSIFSFAQTKKPVNNSFKKEYKEYLVAMKDWHLYFGDFLRKFPLGTVFEKSDVTATPEVDYFQKIDTYEYVYKMGDEGNYIIWVKNGRIIRRQVVIFDMSAFYYLCDFYDLKDKEFLSGKGFKMNDEEYLVILKERHDEYDSYTFDFRGLEFYNIVDYLNSK